MVTVPPVALGNDNDHNAVQLIRSFRENLMKPQSMIQHACNLASGPSDIVIILERMFEDPYYERKEIAQSPTLRAVDDMIRRSTKGTRNLWTVSVLDAYTFKPGKTTISPTDEACHQMIWEVLNLKKPRVILTCWDPVDSPSTYLSPFGIVGLECHERIKNEFIDDFMTTIVRSPDPSRLSDIA